MMKKKDALSCLIKCSLHNKEMVNEGMPSTVSETGTVGVT